MLNTPVLFLVFNRPDLTARVFETIREAKPGKLFIAADGPRKEKEGDAELCRAVRQLVEEGINWPCEVYTLFREENLGCKLAVSSAITWFFEQVEEGIIIEDDCLPDPSFFNFCEELLRRYRMDTRFNFISGTCLPNTASHIYAQSYYFSKFSIIWGWATWRRVWQKYDVAILEWQHLRTTPWLKNAFYGNEYYANGFNGLFDSIMNGYDTWDFQLFFLNLKCNSLNIHPTNNLISNLGFNENGTHTLSHQSHAALKLERIEKIIHPEVFAFDVRSDEFIFDLLYKYDTKPKTKVYILFEKISFRLKKLIK